MGACWACGLGVHVGVCVSYMSVALMWRGFPALMSHGPPSQMDPVSLWGLSLSL